MLVSFREGNGFLFFVCVFVGWKVSDLGRFLGDLEILGLKLGRWKLSFSLKQSQPALAPENG